MRFKKVMIVILLAVLCVSAMWGCEVVATDKGGKIPLTTASEEARHLYMQGRDLQDRLRFQESREILEKVVAVDAEFAMAHLNLALAQPTAKDFFAVLAKATALVDRVSEGEKEWILGFKAGVDGNPMKQREHYKKLVGGYPDDERAHNLLGTHYFAQQMYDEAISEYEKAIAINPKFSPPFNQLGYAYRFLEKYDDSERTFKKYIKLIPDDPNPYDSYAELLLKIGKYDGAIENYGKALELNPNFVASHTGIATSYNFKGEHEKARAQLDKMYQAALDDGQRRGALFARTVSYVDEGNLEKALEVQRKMYDIAESISDHANMAGDLVVIGNILREFGQPGAALKKYNKSLEIMRASSLSDEQKDLAEQAHHLRLTQIFLTKASLAEAKKHAKIYHDLAVKRENRFQIWAAHQISGQIAYAEHDYEKAVAELEQANLQNPYNIHRLAMAYEAKGDKKRAEELFYKASNFNALNNMQSAFMRRHQEKKMMSSKS